MRSYRNFTILILITFAILGCESTPPPSVPEQVSQSSELKEKALAALVARLPDDAAPLEHQVFRYLAAEPRAARAFSLSYRGHGSLAIHTRIA